MSQQEIAQQKLVEIFAHFGKPSKFSKGLFIFLILIVLFAFYALILQMTRGQRFPRLLESPFSAGQTGRCPAERPP